jgi:hypothetical protein
MDPKRDIAGSAEQDALDALKKEELARAQSAVQAQQASSRPPILLRLPVSPRFSKTRVPGRSPLWRPVSRTLKQS